MQEMVLETTCLSRQYYGTLDKQNFGKSAALEPNMFGYQFWVTKPLHWSRGPTLRRGPVGTCVMT